MHCNCVPSESRPEAFQRGRWTCAEIGIFNTTLTRWFTWFRDCEIPIILELIMNDMFLCANMSNNHCVLTYRNLYFYHLNKTNIIVKVKDLFHSIVSIFSPPVPMHGELISITFHLSVFQSEKKKKIIRCCRSSRLLSICLSLENNSLEKKSLDLVMEKLY